jgi:uncharacterized RDD family membrane protein YckC
MDEQKHTPTPAVEPTHAQESHPKTMYFASPWIRLVAFLIDGAVVWLVGSIVGFGSGSSGSTILSFIYSIVLIGASGQTIGCRICKIKVFTTEGGNPGYGAATIRALVSIISAGALGIGYLWAFFTKERQTWHDLAAKTYVVKL